MTFAAPARPACVIETVLNHHKLHRRGASLGSIGAASIVKAAFNAWGAHICILLP